MAFRSDVSVDWAVSPRIIEVASPSDSIIIQDLWDTLRVLEAETSALDDDFLIHESSGGKISAGTYTVVITLVLNNAKLKFEARGSPTVCTVLEGIFGAVDDIGDSMDPRTFSTNTNVDISQAVSGSIDRVDLNDMKYRIEDLHVSHGGYGLTVYWDPWNGDDDSNGAEATTPVLTWARAHELTRAEEGDIIQVLPSGTHDTTISTPIIISKAHISLRGSVDTVFDTPGETAVTITGDACAISNIVVQNTTVGFYSTSTDVLFRRCVAQNSTTGWRCGGLGEQLLECYAYSNTIGVEALAASYGMRLRKSVVYDCGTGFMIRNGAVGSGVIDASVISSCSVYGVKIEAGAIVSSLIDCSIDGNAENVLDEGTGTIFDNRETHVETLTEETRQIREKNIRRYLVRAVGPDATRNVSIDDWDYEQVIIKSDLAADFDTPVDSSQRKVAYEKTYAIDPNHDRPFYYIGHD